MVKSGGSKNVARQAWIDGWRMMAMLVAVVAFTSGQTALASDLSKSLPSLLDSYSSKSTFDLPALDAKDVDKLLTGTAVVKVFGRTGPEADSKLDAMGVFGLKIIDAPRLLIWLAVMGGNDERDYRLTPATLERGDAGSYVRYQHVDLPWPIHDRHWVIQCHKNLPLAEESNGLIWEHHWSLKDNGESLLPKALAAGIIPKLEMSDLENAVYLPRNAGAWALIELGTDRTLAIAYLDADLGGRFPAAVVRRFTRSRLKAGLQTLEEMTGRVHLNYSEDRIIHDGHGKAIRRAAAVQAAENWQKSLRIATLN